MKILHVIDSMDLGGAQSLIVELAPVQKDMGHEVTVLQLLDAYDKTFIRKLESFNINVFALSKKRSVRNFINILDLIPYLKEYDIVHVHLFPAQYWVALAKLISFSRTHIVTTEHSTENNRRKIKIFKYIDSFIYRKYNAVVACSDKAKETFEYYYKDLHCYSIPNGVNLGKYIDALPYNREYLLGISNDSFVITMVARFEFPKRQDTIVKAIALLHINYHAVFVGGHENEDGVIKVKNLAKELGVEQRVHFLYFRSDVPRILKSSDIVALSSEYEGLSLSSIEGMACGHPFVASDVNGLREVVSGAGILVKCGDEKELASVLKRLYEDKEYRNVISSRCLKRAAQYDIKHVAEKYINVYQKCLL